jgi:hypothetical protein
VNGHEDVFEVKFKTGLGSESKQSKQDDLVAQVLRHSGKTKRHEIGSARVSDDGKPLTIPRREIVTTDSRQISRNVRRAFFL